MSEEQEIDKTNTEEDVEGHHHTRGKQGFMGAMGANAEDQELATDEDEVEGHSWRNKGK
jgi:hypothetical protein